ncbi:response regulator [Chamaesiphon minutus]|uniref:histidine kinase n=1 Tax=Chamaesiphon minutus (strain ATCC 27169 / PCC 6605) TaxID=1173020 RepID=K9UKZ6_CHAP6|nr:response regulator [Chamaesiphon minutus]AFY95318.1 chemotaxis protein histidine kinase-like protein [Chamaesiphon minutus PCC 6605]
MITSDQEQQVKLQFLDEATDYLDTIESGLLGLGTGKVTGKQLDALLRAAHSIKGGAAMMGYTTLAGLGHHLEDYFKIIQYGKSEPADARVEQLMLATIDKLRQIVALNRQGQDAAPDWLQTEVEPLFASLRERLGEFNPEDEANMLASESGEDVLTFLFETEVERVIAQLEISVNGEDSSSLYDELTIGAEDLGGLAEMVELPALGSLSASILHHLKSQPHQLRSIAALALAAWRRTQAMVLIGQTTNLPSEIELPGSGIMALSDAETIPEWNDFEVQPATTDRDSIDLQDFAFDPPVTLADLGGDPGAASEYAMLFEEHMSANDLPTLTDPFGDVNTLTPPAFSTITDSSELDQFETNEQKSAGFSGEDLSIVKAANFDTIANSITIEELDTSEQYSSIHTQITLVPDPESEIVDAFEMLDLSGDLSIDTDAPELLSALSGFLAEDSPTDISSAVFKIDPKPKSDRLAQEAADLLSALDAAPEVIDDLPHHNSDKSGLASSKSTAPAVEQSIRVATKQLEEIGDLFGELTIDRNGLNLNLQALRQLVLNLQAKVKQLEQSNFKLAEAYDISSSISNTTNRDPAATWIQEEASLSANFTSQLDILEFDRYSDLHILSQEVMDNIVQIEELTTDLDLQLNDTERTNRDLNRTAKQLQTGLTQVRMRPISELFNRFPRAIRNLSIEHAKPIDLQLKGGTTLIERSILEALNDPLMHLVRNAFDHGIEPSAVRRANNKPDMGTIEISATYRGNQTVITIKDDGGGIDLDKIRAKVKKMGIDDREIAKFKDNELIDLIFEPGFSTADKLTDLSGRGVGMDVVRTNIRALRGDVFVDTKLGKGSTFTITVPFTLSVVRVLIVEVNGLWLAIPSNIVEEIVLLDPDRIISTAGQKMLQWENFTMRLIEPAQYLHLPPVSPQVATSQIPTIDRQTVLTIDQGHDVVAVVIDKFWGEQEVTIRQPQGNIQMPPGFTGCTILGDGRIVPLVDALDLIRWIDGDFAVPKPSVSNFNFRTDDSTPSAPAAAPVQKPRILVVDDSINVRRFVALTLEKAGYLVEQAKDGQEAIEKLQAGLQAQAVVCDVEMPRMDGYGFLATVKGISHLKNIPVLMLTSRSGDKHRKIAMNLGASGYFAKPFKEQELLATLTQLVNK